jgi:hypothetical protein
LVCFFGASRDQTILPSWNTCRTRWYGMLRGTVNSAAERDKAIAIARSTTGVVEVKNNLKFAG